MQEWLRPCQSFVLLSSVIAPAGPIPFRHLRTVEASERTIFFLRKTERCSQDSDTTCNYRAPLRKISKTPHPRSIRELQNLNIAIKTFVWGPKNLFRLYRFVSCQFFQASLCSVLCYDGILHEFVLDVTKRALKGREFLTTNFWYFGVSSAPSLSMSELTILELYHFQPQGFIAVSI